MRQVANSYTLLLLTSQGCIRLTHEIQCFVICAYLTPEFGRDLCADVSTSLITNTVTGSCIFVLPVLIVIVIAVLLLKGSGRENKLL